MIENSRFPRQKLPFKSKTKKWRKSHLDWADNRSTIFNSKVRKSLLNKKINYDLFDGKVNKREYFNFLASNGESEEYAPSKINHYPILNNPLNVLIGEESKRRFDYKIVVTNPLAISEMEKNRMKLLTSGIEQAIKDEGLSEEEFREKVKNMTDYANYEWQDVREVRANQIAKHYVKELGFKTKWNQGFEDALICGEEVYQFDISYNEPVFEKLNPKKMYSFGSGYSNRFEDSDIVIIEDYWSIGKVIDMYYDKLKDADIKYLEEAELGQAKEDGMHNIDERQFFLKEEDITGSAMVMDDFVTFAGTDGFAPGEYFDNDGNVRVLKVFWKSKRKIKKVKQYDEMTGEPTFNFYPETYVLNKEMGEEEELFWINEAWEGVKIGKCIYVNMAPRKVQYNRLENPSKCHFGIIGNIYNTNEGKVVSLLDRLKPYQYLYNFIKDRLIKVITQNLGKIAELDMAKIPEGWDVAKWMWFIKRDHVAFVDSFKEGNKGRSTGKLAGSFNTTGKAIDLDFGNYIQQLIGLLEYIKNELNEISGVSAQRQGQISNRETVGGVERSVVQSSHITERYYMIHDNIKKRCIECLVETAKIALKDSEKKYYIMDDTTSELMNIPGDEFAECDYGICVDNDNYSIALEQKFEQLAHAALQNQTLQFSTIMAIFTDPSISSIKRRIEKDEKATMERAQQTAKDQNEAMLEQGRMAQETRAAELEQEEMLNRRDNETKVEIADKQIAADLQIAGIKANSDAAKSKLDSEVKYEQIKAIKNKPQAK